MMKNGMMKKAAAILLAAAMTVPGCTAVYAEDNTQVEAEAEKQAAEAAAKAEAEKQAAEAAAKAEAEKQAAEAAAKAEAERQAAEAAAKAEAERQAAEAAKVEAERQAAEAAEAAEAAAQAEAERQAAEAAQAEAEKQAAEAAQTEAETEAAETEAQAKETEATEAAKTAKAEAYKTSFKFENDEVVIVVKASEEAKLTKDTKLAAKKLEEGSEKFEAAKAATINSLGSTNEESYSFYEIQFEKDGKELDVQDSYITVNVTFKNEAAAVQVKDGAAKRL